MPRTRGAKLYRFQRSELPTWVNSRFTIAAKFCAGGALIARLLNLTLIESGQYWNVDLTPANITREKLVGSHTFDQWYATEEQAREVYDNIEKFAFLHWAQE